MLSDLQDFFGTSECELEVRANHSSAYHHGKQDSIINSHWIVYIVILLHSWHDSKCLCHVVMNARSLFVKHSDEMEKA